jgi:hypothetical protein
LYLKKDLAKLIEKLIHIDPSLENDLEPIRKKYLKQSKIVMDCWNKLISILNEQSYDKNTRSKMMKLIVPRPSVQKKSGFEPPHPNERILGTIPQNIADTIRKQDRAILSIQKSNLEAQITNNHSLFVEIGKKQARLDIQQKKVWLDLKNHFNLWDNNSQYFSIREKGPMLVLTEPKRVMSAPPKNMMMPQPGQNTGIIQIDPEVLRQIFRMMNIQPPPGMFPDEEGE